ncbi:serine/threonine protein phosphatase [Dokdonia sinensis]|uniref:Serine/threonine protein phosphatase n=1 Tax=Dokdonia sinensis TaxID=2479847 RepID=A0A3M0GGD2_9FLAO|nr:metallophosphoesterase family protein [Dokdonia sinensis]RMB63348.1 serine/threonine protein phosphatase [Dokdonia sinensis]
MGRTLVFGDIHGGLKALKQVMQRAKVSAEDHLIFLGDYVDGWSESAGVIDYLITLSRKQRTTLIRGNHDDLVQQWLEGRALSPKWLQHGGQSTIDSYNAKSSKEIDKHIAFYKTFKDYYIDKENRMFCHAGFQNLNGPEHEWHSTAFYWDRTLWEMVCAMREDLDPEDLFYPKRLKLFTEIFIGHTPVTRINRTEPVNKANVWNLDTGAAFKGTLTVMDVDTKEFWQSDPVMQLYATESGRNEQSYK